MSSESFTEEGNLGLAKLSYPFAKFYIYLSNAIK